MKVAMIRFRSSQQGFFSRAAFSHRGTFVRTTSVVSAERTLRQSRTMFPFEIVLSGSTRPRLRLLETNCERYFDKSGFNVSVCRKVTGYISLAIRSFDSKFATD